MSRYRFGTEHGEALARALCPPHPWEQLYEADCFIDGKRRTCCRRCYHTLDARPLADVLADPPALALALIDIEAMVLKMRRLEER